MSRSVEVRRLLVADAEAFRSIRLQALQTEAAFFGAVHAVEAGRPLRAFAERLETSHGLGAFAGDRLVGLVGFKPQDGAKDRHKGFVWGFYVQPERRRQGVGSALVAGLITAASVVVEQLTLTVVRENTAAITLYERFGFATYGTEPRALKGPDGYADELLMVRFLRPH